MSKCRDAGEVPLDTPTAGASTGNAHLARGLPNPGVCSDDISGGANMKPLMALVASVTLLAAPLAVQDASAQIELNLGGGVNAPTGEYGDQFNTGYALTAGLGYRVVPLAVIGAEVSYSGNHAPDEVTEAVGPGYELTSNILQYGLVAKLVLPVGSQNVYAKGSVGNYRATAKASGPLGEGSITVTDPGYSIGGGFLINGNKMSAFFADVTYHHVNFDGDADTNFFTITAGALIRFDLSKPDLRDDLQDDLDKLRE
jgi:hypothetical protein